MRTRVCITLAILLGAAIAGAGAQTPRPGDAAVRLSQDDIARHGKMLP